MTADPVKVGRCTGTKNFKSRRGYVQLRRTHPGRSFTVLKVCPGRGSDTDLDTLSARRKQKDRREAVFLFVLEDQARHGEKVGDHVAVHKSVADAVDGSSPGT